MFKKLIVIHLILFSPLLFYNTLKWKKLNSLKKSQSTLKNLSAQVCTFSQIECSNSRTKEKHSGGAAQYLYDELESYNLSSGQQKIQLIESPLSENSFYIEKEESLARSVQVDLKELRTILQKVEGDTSKETKPHLLFQEFSIKKNKKQENGLYDFNFKLIKREYL